MIYTFIIILRFERALTLWLFKTYRKVRHCDFKKNNNDPYGFGREKDIVFPSKIRFLYL